MDEIKQSEKFNKKKCTVLTLYSTSKLGGKKKNMRSP